MSGKTIREWLIGPPFLTFRMQVEKLDTIRALAALSPDALSSIAYANQELFLGPVAAGAAGLAAVLILAFGGDTHALIPLFAVGVSIAFTLSQTGMVVHWIKERQAAWLLKIALLYRRRRFGQVRAIIDVPTHLRH